MSTEGDGGQSVGRTDAAAADDDGAEGNRTDERTPLLTQRTTAIDDEGLLLPNRAEARGGSDWVYTAGGYQQDRRRNPSSPLQGRAHSSTENDNASGKHRKRGHCHQNHGNFSDVDFSARRKLIVASIICLSFMIGEIIGGVLANSLAIVTDAAHLLTDFASFLISLFALVLASRPRTKRMNFGWYRAEVMGALLSVLLIWVVTGVLVYLAIRRVITRDYEIDAQVMLITAAVGVFFNLVMGFLLHDHGHAHGALRTCSVKHHSSQHHSHGRHGHWQINEGTSGADTTLHLQSDSSAALINSSSTEVKLRESEEACATNATSAVNINVRAAFIHVLGDLVQSIGVLIAAYIIYYKPEWKLADPVCTFIFSVLVVCTTLRIMRDIVVVLMEGTPSNISFSKVKQTLCSVKGVKDVHNLRFWSITMNRVVLSAHLAIDDSVSCQEVIAVAGRLMEDHFGITDCTIQAEDYVDEMGDCVQCQDPED